MANVQALGVGGLYGSLATTGGGGNVSARDALDWARMGSPGQVPEAQYPDGYLGAVNGRRDGKLANGEGNLNRRPYSRGVHRGERIDPQDYFWPADQKPTRGLAAIARGKRLGLAEPSYVMNAPLVAGGADLPRPQAPATPDPHRATQYSGLTPPWR